MGFESVTVDDAYVDLDDLTDFEVHTTGSDMTLVCGLCGEDATVWVSLPVSLNELIQAAFDHDCGDERQEA